METALESLSKSQLIALVKERDTAVSNRDAKIIHLDQEVGYLKAQVEMYKRMQFGQKRERFEGDSQQMALPFEAAPPSSGTTTAGRTDQLYIKAAQPFLPICR
ncbi:Transposase C of IS166 homeodomain-containing protein [bacterium A37T11]|nr:Transposase C of IS166 homeodomain-containing protein [bacterium A37T11]